MIVTVILLIVRFSIGIYWLLKDDEEHSTIREIEKEKECIEGISIHTNQAEKNILTTGDHIK
jgi:hypothetical protein